MQLRAILFLTGHGIAIRGHTESEENPQQLLKLWSHDNNAIRNWLSENRFTSHQFVNELIDIMRLPSLLNCWSFESCELNSAAIVGLPLAFHFIIASVCV